MKTKELKKVASLINKQFISFPKKFEARWTEFTNSLFLSVLRNYVSLVKYFEKQNDNEAKGFLAFLTDFDKLKTLCFLSDLAFLVSRFQKRIQSEQILIFDVQQEAQRLLETLKKLEVSPLLGGWESKFNDSVVRDLEIDENEDTCEIYSMNGITLIKGKAAEGKSSKHIICT